MRYQTITSQTELARFCESIPSGAAIAFDTEFVSEDRYRPLLCLGQVAVQGQLTLIDGLAIEDMTPFWQLLASEGHETIVHAGRQELCFCLHAIGQRPYRMFDTQIAAGLIGMEYPAAYSTLSSRLLGETLGKGETRTNWRRRPLSRKQIDYALRDVLHLEKMRDILHAQLESLGRLDWLSTELNDWQRDIEKAEFSERWRRISGVASLSAKSAAIAAELWRWREQLAEERNMPPRRVLRDDLLVELARRASGKADDIRVVRGLERRDKRKYLDAIAETIQRALDLPRESWPRPHRRTSNNSQFTLIGQFLTAALGCVCREQHVAPSLVGSAQDVRELIAFHLKGEQASDTKKNPLPSLVQGWRADVVGDTLNDLLRGNLALRVGDPRSEHPLRLSPIGE